MDETLSICRNCGREVYYSAYSEWVDYEDGYQFCPGTDNYHDPEDTPAEAPAGYDAYDMEYDR